MSKQPKPEHFPALYATAWEAVRQVSSLGGNPKPSWDDLTQGKAVEFAASVRRVLSGSTAAEVHDAWVNERLARGWTRGPKDAEAKIHPGLMPFRELETEDKQIAKLIVSVVRAVAVALGLMAERR